MPFPPPHPTPPLEISQPSIEGTIDPSLLLADGDQGYTAFAQGSFIYCGGGVSMRNHGEGREMIGNFNISFPFVA